MERFFPPAQIPGGIDAPVFVRASAELTAPGRSARQRPAPVRRPPRHPGTDLQESAAPGSARPAADVRWLPTGTANAGTPSRGPMSRCSKLGVSAAALSATALREVARKCRLPNPQGELLTLARRYESRADYLLSKYAADDRG